MTDAPRPAARANREGAHPDDDARPLSLRELASSGLAAAIGVQSNRNRERDFRRGSARQYVALGLIGTLLFILAVYLAVKVVLHFALG
ncbi:MAG: DUF2970 domain-containing protein [Gammaproteobacteria bacterium]